MAVSGTKRRPAARRSAPAPTPTLTSEPTGYQRKPKLYVLPFIGEWAGMEVTFRPMRYGDLLDGGITLDWMQPDTPPDEWLAGMTALCEAAASVLVGWNIVDDTGNPVPATLEGLRSLDQDQGVAIVMAWALRVIRVAAPLDDRSSSGATSPAPLIPMESPSPSPES
jgi:hypothetical protein